MKKKILSILVMLTIAVGMLTGCGNSNTDSTTKPKAETAETVEVKSDTQVYDLTSGSQDNLRGIVTFGYTDAFGNRVVYKFDCYGINSNTDRNYYSTNKYEIVERNGVVTLFDNGNIENSSYVLSTTEYTLEFSGSSDVMHEKTEAPAEATTETVSEKSEVTVAPAEEPATISAE